MQRLWQLWHELQELGRLRQLIGPSLSAKLLAPTEETMSGGLGISLLLTAVLVLATVSGGRKELRPLQQDSHVAQDPCRFASAGVPLSVQSNNYRLQPIASSDKFTLWDNTDVCQRLCLLFFCRSLKGGCVCCSGQVYDQANMPLLVLPTRRCLRAAASCGISDCTTRPAMPALVLPLCRPVILCHTAAATSLDQ